MSSNNELTSQSLIQDDPSAVDYCAGNCRCDDGCHCPGGCQCPHCGRSNTTDGDVEMEDLEEGEIREYESTQAYDSTSSENGSDTDSVWSAESAMENFQNRLFHIAVHAAQTSQGVWNNNPQLRSKEHFNRLTQVIRRAARTALDTEITFAEAWRLTNQAFTVLEEAVQRQREAERNPPPVEWEPQDVVDSSDEDN